MSKSKIVLYFCLSFIGGIFLSSFFNFSQLILLILLILGIFLISVFWQYKKSVIIGFWILFLVAGIWRYQMAEFKIENNDLKKLNDLDQKISFIGQVVKDPDIREKNIKMTIKPEKMDGKILVTTNRYPEYYYGDKLKIVGKLKTPQVFEDFNYRDYLKKDGIYSVMDWPKIELIEKNQGNLILAKILSFKEKLRESIYQNLSPPQGSILAAMILGDKSQMSGCSPKEIETAQERGEKCLKLKEKLNLAGVRHITAISGMHVAILTSILMNILIGLGFWRQQAFYFTIILIILFIIMTGLQPSAIRAGIMAGLFLFAQYLGRLNTSSRAIVFAATLMLAQNPLLLKLDAGFQLSFLAMLGIIYLLLIFQNFLKKFPNFFQLRNLLAMTLAAQVFTLPILIYNFGYVSAVAPITNVLIVPLLPFIIGFGFIFSLASIIWQPLGWILSFPAWLLLTYLTKVVDWFSSISFATLTLKVSWLWLFLLYLILGLITWHLNEKQKPR
jgi:competence protein ComEC